MDKKELICETYEAFEERFKTAKSFEEFVYTSKEMQTLTAFLGKLLDIEGDADLKEYAENIVSKANAVIEKEICKYNIEDILATIITWDEPKYRVSPLEPSYKEKLMQLINTL